MTGRFDLAAYREQTSAAASEAQEETFTVYLGQSKDEMGNLVDDTIEIPPLRKWSIASQKMIADGDIVGGITSIVGPEDGDKFDAYDWTFGEFEGLMDALSQWQGFKMGRPSSTRRGPGSTQA